MLASVTELDVSTLWSSLAEDANVPLWIVDATGRIEFASRAAINIMADGRPVTGRSLGDLLPGDIGLERLGMISRVASNGRPILMIEMVRGRWSRTVIRRLCVLPRPVVLVLHCLGWNGREQPRPDEFERYDVIEPRSHDAGVLACLTRREMEVLALIGEGLSTLEIAARLSRTPKTVEWHRSSLGRKLNLGTKIELAQLAIASGLTSETVAHLPHRDVDDERNVAHIIGARRLAPMNSLPSSCTRHSLTGAELAMVPETVLAVATAQ